MNIVDKIVLVGGVIGMSVLGVALLVDLGLEPSHEFVGEGGKEEVEIGEGGSATQSSSFSSAGGEGGQSLESSQPHCPEMECE